MKRRRPVTVRRLKQWVRVVQLHRGNYAVFFADELGQLVAFDTHGPLIESRLSPRRDLRLEDIIRRNPCFSSF